VRGEKVSNLIGSEREGCGGKRECGCVCGTHSQSACDWWRKVRDGRGGTHALN
jgi:hypothetical protein